MDWVGAAVLAALCFPIAYVIAEAGVVMIRLSDPDDVGAYLFAGGFVFCAGCLALMPVAYVVK